MENAHLFAFTRVRCTRKVLNSRETKKAQIKKEREREREKEKEEPQANGT